MMLFGVSVLLVDGRVVENKSLGLFIATLPALTYLASFYDALT